MLIITDRKIPEEAADTLARHGEVLLFGTEGITYEAVSGHPDVFLCQVNETLVVAPNTPEAIKRRLVDHGIRFVPGESQVGEKYPATARYNAVCAGPCLLHNFRYTDAVITRLAEDLDLIHLSQGYSRCNLLPLPDGSFITSDEGIFRVLTNLGKEVLKVGPEGIRLPGFSHGFIGGTAGVLGDTVFFAGSLHHYSGGESIRKYLAVRGLRYIELYNGPLFDVGSLFFFPDKAGQ